MPGPEANLDPFGAVTGSSLTQNPNHSSFNDVSTTIDTPLTCYQPSYSKSASALPLICEEIERYIRGHSPYADLWLRYYLSPDDLSALQKLIRENSHWGDKLRYDYFPRTSLFVLRMAASSQHESLQEGFCEFVKRELRRLYSGDLARETFVDQIHNECHTAIREGKIGSHSPDAQFGHEQAQYPGVVLEVAYPQKSKDLPELARIYITEGYRGTQLVVALDQDYQRSKKIVLKTWRPQIKHSSGNAPPRLSVEHQSQEFRSHDGKPVPGSRLQIPIVDFAPKALVPETLHDKSITISSEEFCHYLDRRERTRQMRAARRGIVHDLPPGSVHPPSPASSASDTPSDDDEESIGG
ncbi:uncharacterized protein Z520_02032 [Fonsecaea multimorphosa CBS 102226]|uniref:Uncharacterized protein n=1 Tax=Fonsecaea multimorphosa CBS 102226 TaxID=1442371 RepID=A0A0D2KYK3_9EURO|nr:uncharacterized protein Z520_02032 [Fonsecaea multimorphosa CBS 102226]KIY01894.1 hypothetical protein Z520_02032 [Fonsecaea multimorphosa CBS 102226]OAL29578.1 hypothetical protein AYO22_01992 [Fonsecaea multimorphosa]